MKRSLKECFNRDQVIISLDRMGHEKFVYPPEWYDEERICDEYYDFLAQLDEKRLNLYLKKLLPKEEWEFPYAFANDAFKIGKAKNLFWKKVEIDKKGRLIFSDCLPEGFKDDEEKLPSIEDEY